MKRFYVQYEWYSSGYAVFIEDKMDWTISRKYLGVFPTFKDVVTVIRENVAESDDNASQVTLFKPYRVEPIFFDAMDDEAIVEMILTET